MPITAPNLLDSGMNTRTAARLSALALVLAALSAGCSTSTKSGSAPGLEVPRPVSGSQALAIIKEGNSRFVSGHPLNPSIDHATMEHAAKDGQQPFVTVLSCSDSRAPAERLLDRGVGEVFVIRVAGNVTAPHETGSIEYSIKALKVPLVVVLGHTHCGAVHAACDNVSLTPNINSFIQDIDPVVRQVRATHPDASKERFEEEVTEENVRHSISSLYATSPLIREAVASGQVQVAGGIVDISTGKINWLADVPKP